MGSPGFRAHLDIRVLRKVAFLLCDFPEGIGLGDLPGSFQFHVFLNVDIPESHHLMCEAWLGFMVVVWM